MQKSKDVNLVFETFKISLKGQPLSKFEIKLIFNFQESNVQNLASFACTEI